MNHEGDLTAAQPELTPGASTPPSSRTRSWFARYPLVLFSATGAVVAAAIAVAAVLLLAQPNPSIEKMVPATHDVMVIANLNPSLAQKVNLLRAVHSFPDTRTDAAIAAKLDEALKQSGLSFTTDVQPWLGSEVGVSGKMNFESGADSPYALFATSRDDARAKAALATLRSGALGKKYTWRDETYNGISIASGTPTVTSEKPVAYSLVDHVVVLASSSAIIHEIIDTDQGRAARLVDSPDFKATMRLLPSDRVGMGYIAGKSIVAGVKKQMAKPSTLGLPALKTLDDLNALQGIGGAVSATGTGVAFDVAVKLDVNKLSPATRQAFNATGHPDAVLRWIPKSSDGFLAIANVDQSIKTLLSQYGSDPSLQASTDAVGLTGAKGIVPHLTGDLGVEVELGNNSIPSGECLLRQAPGARSGNEPAEPRRGNHPHHLPRHRDHLVVQSVVGHGARADAVLRLPRWDGNPRLEPGGNQGRDRRPCQWLEHHGGPDLPGGQQRLAGAPGRDHVRQRGAAGQRPRKAAVELECGHQGGGLSGAPAGLHVHGDQSDQRGRRAVLRRDQVERAIQRDRDHLPAIPTLC
jgi:hypothetical protein